MREPRAATKGLRHSWWPRTGGSCVMDRRQFLFILSGAAALLSAARTGHAECGEQTANEFVGELYRKQSELLAANKPLSDDEFFRGA
jgi:hypothetical protein